MLLELHCHSSKHSACSVIDPVTLVKQVVKKHLQGIVITEHCYLWPQEEIDLLRRESEVEDNFLILAGQEAETDLGHVLVFGADRSITERTGLKELREEFPDAALIWAHPFRGGRMQLKEQLSDKRLDAIEIFNNNQSVEENYRGLAAWHRYKFAAIGGTDTHDGVVAGKFPTQLDHPVSDMKGLVAEIKGGRCRPFFKEIPKSGTNIVVTEITLGTKGDDEMRDRIILKKISDKAKWKKLERSLKIMGGLYEKGFGAGHYRIPKIIDIKKDEMMLIEEGQRGGKLFDLLLKVDPSVGKDYFALAARWLARFHDTGIKVSGVEDAVKKENKRFASYLKAFAESKSPYLDTATMLIERVKGFEDQIFEAQDGLFVQNHGDYHPKNIIIGQDFMQDISTVFVSVIDFDNSIFFSRAFDVGYFLAQLRSQYHSSPDILAIYRVEDFIGEYIKASSLLEKKGFLEEVRMFTVRAYLSIASYLIKVGKGESPEMKDLLDHALVLIKN